MTIKYYQNELDECQAKLAKCQIELINMQALALDGVVNKRKRNWTEKAIKNYKYKIEKLQELITIEEEGVVHA